MGNGKAQHTPPSCLVFDVTNHPTRLHVVEALRGKGGFLNLCLIEFLKQFGIALDSSNDGEDFDVERYFDRFTSAISANPTWSIDRQAVVLGFFSFFQVPYVPGS
jgi:hypothetical protein